MMKPFKFFIPIHEQEYRFEIHGVELALFYSIPGGEIDMHEELSVRSMIQDVIETWRFYRNNIDQRVLDIIEETLADHLIGNSRVVFVN